MSKAAFRGLLLLAGLDVTVSIKVDLSASALSGVYGDEKVGDVRSVALSSGASMQVLRREADYMRREPLEAVPATGSRLANDIVDLLSMTSQSEVTDAEMKKGGRRLASDLADLLADRDQGDPESIEEVKKACFEAKAMLAARPAAENSPLLTTVLLATNNISAETLAAEADPCKALHDRLNNAMEGHVIVHKGGQKLEVPVDRAIKSPVAEEEQQLKRAVTIFLSVCGFVGFSMIVIFIATLVFMKNKKGAAKAKGSATEEAIVEDKDTRLADIAAGTILVCVPLPDADEPHAEIYESATSKEIIGTVPAGDSVVATGVVEVDDEGLMMVPIKPKGAVNMTDFQIAPADATDDQDVPAAAATADDKSKF